MAVQPLLLEAVPQTISFSVRGCLLILDTLLKTKSCPDLLDIINMNGIFPCLFATIIFKDLDLTRPAAPRNPPRPQFETSTKEVLRKADFRTLELLASIEFRDTMTMVTSNAPSSMIKLVVRDALASKT
ncbi:unnamed protein product [Triticum turgidum subsp. durum]|uniref:Uncharacterized protein n=1 Tax=Triticum turgidum subsp. durum TaxID=4567 RepID=A0A9R1R2R0_TRITD|nr:unnamed protein product [Triticum turgidum subsp. durum]